MPRAFITGITGQDGSYLAELLLEQGWSVHGVGRGSFPRDSPARASDQFAIHDVDLLDWSATERLLNEAEPDVIFNLAAVSSVAQSWQQPAATMELNAVLPAHLLEWAEQRSDGSNDVRLVQASSAEIFGDAPHEPQTESTPRAPINPYGASKAAAHALVEQFRAKGIHASSAILYNHESPRRPAQFVTRRITSSVARIAKGDLDVLTLGNLDATRDWGWAPDYVDALWRIAQADAPADYIVATGESHSVRDFAQAAFTAAGMDDWEDRVSVDHELVRPQDATTQRGDSTRIKQDLGWRTTKNFEQTVAAMVEHDLNIIS